MPLILVVEQEQRYVERIEEALSPQGWEVVGVDGRSAAMRQVADRAADLVVVNAEVVDASEMIRAFARANGGPGAVVLLPESGDNGVDQEGADEVLRKPFTDQDIRLAVRRCLAASRRIPDEAEPSEPAAGERLSSADIFGDVVLELEGAFNLGGPTETEAVAAEPEASPEEPETLLEVEETEAAVGEVAPEEEPEEELPVEAAEAEDEAREEEAVAAVEVAPEEEPEEELPVEAAEAEYEAPEEGAAAAVEVAPEEESEEELLAEAAEAEVEAPEEEAAAAMEVAPEEEPEEELLVEAAEAEVEAPEEEAAVAEPDVEEAIEEALAEWVDEEPAEEEETDERDKEVVEVEAVEEEEVAKAEDDEAAAAAADVEEPAVRKKPEKKLLEERLREAVVAGKAMAASKESRRVEMADAGRTADLLLQKALGTLSQPTGAGAEIDPQFAEPAHATDEEVDDLVGTIVGHKADSDTSPSVDEPAEGRIEDGEEAPVLDVMESELPGGDEGEYRARMKLLWAIIIIALLATLAFILTRPSGDEAAPEPAAASSAPETGGEGDQGVDASTESPDGNEAESADDGTDGGSAGEADGAEPDDVAQREQRLRQELEAEKRQLQAEISRTQANRRKSDSEEDGGGARAPVS